MFITTAYSCFDRSGGTDLSWIPSVTAVCGHWRAIALECPSLWCFIGFKHPSWPEEMSKHSKMASLIIKVNDHFLAPKVMDAIHSALQHISRIRELYLVTSEVNIVKLFDRINRRATPLLRSLHLSNGATATNTRYPKCISLMMAII